MSDPNTHSHTRRFSFLNLRSLLPVLFVVASATFTVRAQEATPSPTPSERETRLTEENRLLELEKKNAELKKSIREAQPQPSSTPLEGKTTADENVIIETQMVTYKAMSDVADRIGHEIHQKFGDKAKSIAIYDAEELKNIRHYRSSAPLLNGRIDVLKQQYANIFRELNNAGLGAASSASPAFEKANESVGEKAGESSKKSEPSTKFSTSSGASKFKSTASVTGPIGDISVGLKAFADLLALFRTDTDIKGKSVSVSERAMAAETFRALRNRFGNDFKLYYPAVVTPEGDFECAVTDDFCSPILKLLAGLYVEKERAEELLLKNMFDVTTDFGKLTGKKAGLGEEIKALAKQIDDLKLERLRAELAKPWTPAKRARFEKFISELEARKAAAVAESTAVSPALASAAKKKNLLELLQNLNNEAAQMVGNLAKPNETTGRSELANLLRAENLDKAIGANGYWLEFQSLSAGGNNRTRSNLFRYFSGAKLDHSGGIIVEWALYDRNGVSVDSNKDSSYPGYFVPKQIAGGKLEDKVADPTARPVVAKSGDQ